MSHDFDRGYKAGFRDGRTTREPAKGAAGQEESPLTIGAIKKLTSAEVNARWDEILPILEAQNV